MNDDRRTPLWTLIRTRANSARLAGNQILSTKVLSLYRYDSTGRVVHYGPGGDVIEDESTFQVKDVRGDNVTLSRLVPKKRTLRFP
jgi:hypothetical protein